VRALAVSILVALLPAGAAMAQQGDGTDVTTIINVWKPRKVPADDAHLSQLRVAPGFSAKVFARELGNPRIIAVAKNGDVYVSRRDQGDVMLLRDADRNGAAGQSTRTDSADGTRPVVQLAAASPASGSATSIS